MTWVFFQIVDLPRPGGGGAQLLSRTSEHVVRAPREMRHGHFENASFDFGNWVQYQSCGGAGDVPT
jgi:hypothetical protein